MIKNERQYRITKVQAAQFADALRNLEAHSAEHLHPVLRRAQADAIRSQHADLEAELRAYEALQRDRPAIIDAQSLEELPNALIRARIALGLSQKELADKMGIKEQQLQRYEATEYAAASLTRLREVANALGVRISERVFLPIKELTRDSLYARLETAGIDSAFLLNRLLPADIATDLESEPADAPTSSIDRATSVISHIFGWRPEQINGAEQLEFSGSAAATARFKFPGGVHAKRVQAYIVYAHYLAMVVANASLKLPTTHLTSESDAMRRSLLGRSQTIELRSVINFFWDSGIPVLPLNDVGAFHGACWRVSGRNVIVTKQRSKFLARWVFDLLHEWRHATECPEEPNQAWIEESELASTRRTSTAEQAASRFAGDVVLNSRAEELVAKCVERARGNIPYLKSVVPEVAQNAGVSVDHLANYLAWRLSLQGTNWWGTANNLQTQVGDPVAVAREVFYERFDFGSLSPLDARLLARALANEGAPV